MFFLFFYFIYNFSELGEIRNILVSLSLFISFSLIPLENIKNKNIINIISIITKYTGGIYYYQIIIYSILEKFSLIKERPFLSCFMIYILGYFICMIGMKIFKSNKLKYLFI